MRGPWLCPRVAARVGCMPAAAGNLLLRTMQRVGPVAGAKQALNLAAVRGNNGAWVTVDGNRLVPPLLAPLERLVRFLHEAWRDPQ